MRTLVKLAFVAPLLALAPAASAADQTIMLEVDNMSCATCPVIVRGALKGVSGVKAADVSLPHRTAVVTFDDDAADIAALIEATTNAGFPSRMKEE